MTGWLLLNAMMRMTAALIFCRHIRETVLCWVYYTRYVQNSL